LSMIKVDSLMGFEYGENTDKEISMPIQSNCMRYSTILRNLAKRAQITLELLQKVICYPLECMNNTKKITIFNDFRKFFLLGLAHFELQHLLTKKNFQFE
jgi:hypothetical protein